MSSFKIHVYWCTSSVVSATDATTSWFALLIAQTSSIWFVVVICQFQVFWSLTPILTCLEHSTQYVYLFIFGFAPVGSSVSPPYSSTRHWLSLSDDICQCKVRVRLAFYWVGPSNQILAAVGRNSLKTGPDSVKNLSQCTLLILTLVSLLQFGGFSGGKTGCLRVIAFKPRDFQFYFLVSK